MMKKLVYTICTAGLIAMTGCSEKLLDTENLYEKSLDNFYSSPQDINEAMSGVYNALYMEGVHSEEGIAANWLSDMMLGAVDPMTNRQRTWTVFKIPRRIPMRIFG